MKLIHLLTAVAAVLPGEADLGVATKEITHAFQETAKGTLNFKNWPLLKSHLKKENLKPYHLK
jgi:hypothetical protein